MQNVQQSLTGLVRRLLFKYILYFLRKLCRFILIKLWITPWLYNESFITAVFHDSDENGSLCFAMGVRLILRSKLGKMTVDEKRPEMLPAIAQDERSKCKNSLTAGNGPSHT